MSVYPGPGSASSCHVLREDPELAEAIPASRRAQAVEGCVARELHVPVGHGVDEGNDLMTDGALGMLVLGGLMLRRVGIEGRFGAELLGEGDLLRPWQWNTHSPTLPLETRWSIVEPARVALLDETFVARFVSEFPELASAVVERAMQRARNLGVQMAIVHQARVDVRLHMLLWHLAARWGRVRSEGTVLRMRLTHALLAELVAARRPTVTSALSELSKQGQLRVSGDEWVLLGGPPRELVSLAAEVPSETPERLASRA